MPTQLTAEDARQSLTAHVAAKGITAFCDYGPRFGWTALQRLLQDTSQVRYPCEIVFDATSLRPGECAHPEPRGERPEAGFTMYVHPYFQATPDRVVPLVLYQLVAVNFGAFASAHDAETFGAAALGLTCDEYYAALCALADELAAAAATEASGGAASQTMRAPGQPMPSRPTP